MKRVKAVKLLATRSKHRLLPQNHSLALRACICYYRMCDFDLASIGPCKAPVSIVEVISIDPFSSSSGTFTKAAQSEPQ